MRKVAGLQEFRRAELPHLHNMLALSKSREVFDWRRLRARWIHNQADQIEWRQRDFFNRLASLLFPQQPNPGVGIESFRQIFLSPTSEMPYFFASFNSSVVQTSS
jgi:hypothetical protein